MLKLSVGCDLEGHEFVQGVQARPQHSNFFLTQLLDLLGLLAAREDRSGVIDITKPGPRYFSSSPVSIPLRDLVS